MKIIKSFIKQLLSDIFKKMDENHELLQKHHENILVKFQNIRKEIDNLKKEIEKKTLKIQNQEEEINEIKIKVISQMKNEFSAMINKFQQSFVTESETRNHIIAFTQLTNRIFDNTNEIKKVLKKKDDE